jgi:hypothetical protein
MKTIHAFTKGDEIVRIEPSKPYSSTQIGLFGEETIETRDRSYMGEKLIFVGIANGQIYLKRTDNLSIELFGDKLLSLSLDVFDDGWDYWFDPENLLQGLEPKESLIHKLENAVKIEDYELATKLRDELEKNTNTLNDSPEQNSFQEIFDLINRGKTIFEKGYLNTLGQMQRKGLIEVELFQDGTANVSKKLI